MDWLNYKNCMMCPRQCGADRTSIKLGYCRIDDQIHISSICIHHGEEPVISGDKGICNIFFSHCNLQCIFCQNYQISSNKTYASQFISLESTVDKIISILKTGIKRVGFVSPSHQVKQMITIIEEIQHQGYHPVFIYNTNAYDLVEIIDLVDPYIQVYLPDFKYADSALSLKLSGAADYPQIALAAIKRMIYHKGAKLLTNINELAEWGIIIRHLVIPGNVDNSKKVLEVIAEELSTSLRISLMSQYNPLFKALNHSGLNRKITSEEYTSVIKYMESLGFYNFWLQEIESSEHYNPDFLKENPFH